MRDKCFDDHGGVFATVLNDVQNTGGETSVMKYSADKVVGAGTEFRGLESDMSDEPF